VKRKIVTGSVKKNGTTLQTDAKVVQNEEKATVRRKATVFRVPS